MTVMLLFYLSGRKNKLEKLGKKRDLKDTKIEKERKIIKVLEMMSFGHLAFFVAVHKL